MTALIVVVRSSALTEFDLAVLGVISVVMLPILAAWFVSALRACSDKVRRLVGGAAVALALGGILPLFYYPCYWFMVECWF